jgi:hydrogenase/urease accessory protein HupE
MKRVREFGSGLPALIGIFAITTVCIFVFSASLGFAHEVRPGYLALKEVSPGTFDVLFKIPMRGDFRLALQVTFSGRIEPVTPISSQTTDDAIVQTWRMVADELLGGQEVRIDGLQNTMTDALVRIEFFDGRTWLQRLTPASPGATIPKDQSSWTVAVTYLHLGIEHILLGFDHLLFVLALMLVSVTVRQLVQTITAFTVAHSITLAAATLGFVEFPSKPIEAVIALSIVFVAAEVVRARRGETGLATRFPWLIAFVFGLLHGFGFAGVLGEIGLPAGHVPEALLFFNIGVEIGQLGFVGVVLGVIGVLRAGRSAWPRWAPIIPSYAIGIVAMFWVIERVAAF